MLVKREIDGIIYTARYNGFKYAAEFYDDCMTDGRVLMQRVAAKIFRDVIIDPPVNVDDFDTKEKLEKVLDFALDVAINGNEKEKTKFELRESMLRKWDGYRLIFSDIANFDYETVFYRMTPQEIAEANLALDEVMEQIRG